MCSGDPNMGTISDTTHLKMIFSLLPCNGMHFIGNTYCSIVLPQKSFSFCTFSQKTVSYKAGRKNPEESNLENEWAREWFTLFLSSDQILPVQKGTNMTGEVRWCTFNWKTVPTGTLYKALFYIVVRKVSPVTLDSSKKKGPITSFFIKEHHIYLQCIILMFSNMRIFTSLYMTLVPVDFHT